MAGLNLFRGKSKCAATRKHKAFWPEALKPRSPLDAAIHFCSASCQQTSFLGPVQVDWGL